MYIKLKVEISNCYEIAEQASRIAKERINEIKFDSNFIFNEITIKFELNNINGYIIDITGNNIVIKAFIIREFIAGIGKLLELLYEASETNKFPSPYHYEEVPAYELRYHHMPAHFGNSFEVMSIGEMKRYLEDMTLAGASGYGDWFDANDMPDPYNPQVYCSTSMSLWMKKKQYLIIAKQLGLDTLLWVAHNVAFVDQINKENCGVKSSKLKVQGQVLCPSNKAGREICLMNQRNLFSDLVASGVKIDKILYNAYDDGGCACDKCQPYYPTFLKMVEDIHKIIVEYYPAIKLDICGWWISDDERELVKEFAKNKVKEWFSTYQFSVTYNVYKLPEVRKTLGDLDFSTFFHIAFSNTKEDVYFKSGVHIAANRIQSVIKSFKEQGCKGFHTYNESVGDHLNVYLSSKLGRTPDADVTLLLKNYCRMMFGLKGKSLDDITDILLDMQYLDQSKAKNWYNRLLVIEKEVTTPFRQQWSFEHIIIKAKLLSLDYMIGDGSNWNKKEDLDSVLPLIEERNLYSEILFRDVYGFGVLRHAFIERRMVPVWYEQYEKMYPVNNGLIKPGSVMSDEA